MLKIMLILIFTIPILLSVAFITLLERKFLSLVGLRLGPNKVLLGGIGQPLMDALKLMQKQTNFLMNYSYLFYYTSATIMLMSSMMIWSSSFLDFSNNVKSSIILIMLLLGVNSVASVMAGWSVFSKFSLLGSIRTVSLLISYESVLYFILMMVIYFYISMELSEYQLVGSSFAVIMPMSFMLWYPAMLADLNRTPYDFSEGESELVSGFNTEFGSSSFTLIFLAEYSNIIFLSVLTWLIYFSNSSILSFSIIFLTVIWLRSVLPRYRFDKLMALAWKFFIPMITVIFISCVSNWV